MLKQIKYIAVFSLLFSLASLPSLAQSNNGQHVNSTNIGCQLYMPNAFTPNGDNINERFVITYGDNCRMVDFNMKIFDRWGRLVFEANTSDRESAWDGTSEGRKLSKGVYLYDVQATMEPFNGGDEIKKINRQGTVVLIR